MQDKWKLADRALKTHLARATRGNPAAKRLFKKQDWKNSRDIYAAIVDRFQLRENSYRIATLANLFNLEAGTDSLQNLLDRLDGHITALENLREVVSDAMKVTILSRALTASRVPLHVRVADTIRFSTVDLQFKDCRKIALDFGMTEAGTGSGTDKRSSG